MGQLKTQALQQQEAGLKLQQAQLQMKSQQAMMQAFVEGDGDIDKTVAAMRNHPDILPSDYLGMQQHVMQLATEKAGLTEKQKALEDHDNQAWASIIKSNGINSQDDLTGVISQGVGRGLKVPTALLNPQGQVTPYTGDPSHYQAIANSLQMLPQISTQKLQEMQAQEAGAKGLQAQAEAGKATAETGKAKIETEKLQYGVDLYKSLMAHPGDLMVRVGRTVDAVKYPQLFQIALNEASQQPTIEDINKSMEKWGGIVADIEKEKDPTLRANKVNDAIKTHVGEQAGEANLIVPGLAGGAPAAAAPTAPGMTPLPGEPIIRPGPGAPVAASAAPSGAPLTGEAYLATLPPITRDQIRAIADGRMSIESIGRNPVARGRLQQAMMQYDPTWSEQRAQLRSAFTTGPEAVNIGNLNTSAVHAQQFLDAAEAMKGGLFRPGNATFNWMRKQFGSALPTNLEGIKAAWASEMASALKGNATDPEIASVKSAIDSANSWDQFKGIVNENLKILGAKLNTYHERAQAQNLGDWSPVMPSAREVFQKHGMDPTAPPSQGRAAVVVIDGKGKPHTFNSEQEAKRYEDLVKQHGGKTSRQ